MTYKQILIFIYLSFVFETRTQYIALGYGHQAGLKLRDSTTLAFRVLGLKVCTFMVASPLIPALERQGRDRALYELNPAWST